MNQSVLPVNARIAVTGASGFVGRATCQRLRSSGFELRCWRRSGSDTSQMENLDIDWVHGELGNGDDVWRLIEGCDALVHAGLFSKQPGFVGAEGDLITYAQRNVIGSLQLFEAAQRAKLKRVVFVSSCAVHEVVLEDRPLDESHPLWQLSHYGASKAAVEQFVSSFGRGHGLPICAVRPCSIYGVDSPVENSKFMSIVSGVVLGRDVHCEKGGKYVHVDDVAAAIETLLRAPVERVVGEVFTAFDRYISEIDVADLAKQMSSSKSKIRGNTKSAKHLIETGKLRSLGFEFGGSDRLRSTVAELVRAARSLAG